jgi:hypothetical protein
MRKPNDSLDDYIVKPVDLSDLKPPRAVSLRGTGEVEILQPLTSEDFSTTRTFMFRRASDRQPVWFRRMICAGSGVLAWAGIVLISAIFMGLSEQTSGPTVGTGGQFLTTLTPAEEPYNFDLSTSFPPVTLMNAPRPSAKRFARKVRQAVASGTRRYTPSLQPALPKFVPTTLVIYAEDGVVKTRVEPWIQSS